MLSFLAVMTVFAVVAEESAAPAPVRMNLANFRTYKSAANGGKVETVAPFSGPSSRAPSLRVRVFFFRGGVTRTLSPHSE